LAALWQSGTEGGTFLQQVRRARAGRLVEVSVLQKVGG